MDRAPIAVLSFGDVRKQRKHKFGEWRNECRVVVCVRTVSGARHLKNFAGALFFDFLQILVLDFDFWHAT